jgi:hypothetical protein
VSRAWEEVRRIPFGVGTGGCKMANGGREIEGARDRARGRATCLCLVIRRARVKSWFPAKGVMARLAVGLTCWAVGLGLTLG